MIPHAATRRASQFAVSLPCNQVKYSRILWFAEKAKSRLATLKGDSEKLQDRVDKIERRGREQVR